MANLVAGEAPSIGDGPAMIAFADTILVEVGPEVISAAPAGIIFEDNTIDNLVASISNGDGYLASVKSAGEALETLTSPEAFASLVIDTASADPININASEPTDSSDIVVEMAAQILLPAPQLNNSLTRFIQPSPATEALLSDKLSLPIW